MVARSVALLALAAVAETGGTYRVRIELRKGRAARCAEASPSTG